MAGDTPAARCCHRAGVPPGITGSSPPGQAGRRDPAAALAPAATRCHTRAGMTDDAPDAPLPAGLRPAGLLDLLPPEAEREAVLVEALMAAFADHGYELLKPPLLE